MRCKILQFKSNRIKVFLPKCKDASTSETSINYNSPLWKVREEKSCHGLDGTWKGMVWIQYFPDKNTEFKTDASDLKTIQKSTQTTNDITPENVTSTHAGERTCVLTATTDSLVCSGRFHMARTKRKSMIIAERQANFSVFLNKLSTWKSKRLNWK